jgi:hypothetical protein
MILTLFIQQDIEACLIITLLVMMYCIVKQKRAQTERLVDLYCIGSRYLYYNMDTKELIRGDDAKCVHDQIIALRWKNKIGELKREQGIRADVWDNWSMTVISGDIYKL